MRLCRYDDDRLGVVLGDRIHDVSQAQDEIRKAAPYAMLGDAVIASLDGWRERLQVMAREASSKKISEARLLPPVARPSKVIAAPVNYGKHIDEMTARGDKLNFKWLPKIAEAGLFLKANSSLVGPSDGVPLRFLDRSNEHEVEIALVIGKQGSDIPREKALEYVAGYCLGLDMTARGSEDRSFRKSIDGYAVLGPWLVTADEIQDPGNMPLSIAVNGEIRQDGNTKDLIFDIPRLIEFASSFYTLYPGDVLYTGTPEGVGPVKPGDVMTVKSAPLGEMDVPVRAHAV